MSIPKYRIMYIDLDQKDCASILENNYISHLSYLFLNEPYVVPITYFYNKDKNLIICYSGEGHKMEAMRKYKQVAINVVELDALTMWKSVTAHGKFEQVFGSEAKSYLHDFSLGIKKLVARKELTELSFINQFSSQTTADNLPMVFVIHIDRMTGKMRRP